MKLRLLLGFFGLSALSACGGASVATASSALWEAMRCPFEPHVVVVTGRLVRADAIGGESTGYGVATPGGELLQLDLRALVPGPAIDRWIGRKVRVGGELRCVEGVESGWRRVLTASSLNTVA